MSSVPSLVLKLTLWSTGRLLDVGDLRKRTRINFTKGKLSIDLYMYHRRKKKGRATPQPSYLDLRLYYEKKPECISQVVQRPQTQGLQGGKQYQGEGNTLIKLTK